VFPQCPANVPALSKPMNEHAFPLRRNPMLPWVVPCCRPLVSAGRYSIHSKTLMATIEQRTTRYYDALVHKMLACGDPDKMGDSAYRCLQCGKGTHRVLSRVQGDWYARFCGEGVIALSSPYPRDALEHGGYCGSDRGEPYATETRAVQKTPHRNFTLRHYRLVE
jgi:hypothetical protein